MAKVEVYTTTYCWYCRRATALLAQKRVRFVEIDVTHEREIRAWLRARTGRSTVPQIFINGEPVGGYDDIAALDRVGELDRLLAREI